MIEKVPAERFAGPSPLRATGCLSDPTPSGRVTGRRGTAHQPRRGFAPGRDRGDEHGHEHGGRVVDQVVEI